MAVSGTVIIDRYTPAGATVFRDTVRFRLINATFVPTNKASQSTGNFTFNVNGAIN